MDRHDFDKMTRDALNEAVALEILDAVELGCLMANHGDDARKLMREITEIAFTGIHDIVGRKKHADWCGINDAWHAARAAASTSAPMTGADLIAELEKFDDAVMYHNAGLVRGAVKTVKTDRVVVDGQHAVVVYKDRVELAACSYPTNFNRWTVWESRSYDTAEEALALVKELTAAKKAAVWA
jgi:hypothetical protein